MRPLLRIALALSFALGAVPLAAQDSLQGKTFGDWQVDCTALGEGHGCILQQSFTLQGSGAPVAQVLMFWSHDASRKFIGMRVPLGSYLPGGIEIRAEDEDQAQPLIWQSCVPLGCDAVHDLSDERLANFSDDGGAALAGYVPALGKDPMVFRFSMAGALEGLEALRPPAR